MMDSPSEKPRESLRNSIPTEEVVGDPSLVESSLENCESLETFVLDKPSKGECGEKFEVSSESGVPSKFGRYKIVRLLGKGSFGEVYHGYDDQLARQVAIKVPHLNLLSEVVEKEFLIEARQLAKLRHPGIVTVFDLGVENGRCFIVSDYLEGKTLSDFLKKVRPTWQQTARIIADIADALAHAHAQRTVHRDLKPANIILVEEEKPVLVDFGLAISDLLEQNTRKGVVAGTPAFMSPEQVRGAGHRIDGRTDIYALGVILYCMLTGRRPFEGASLPDVMRQILEDEPQPPRQLVRNIPKEIEAICLKAMAKKLRDRYLTADDMALELRKVIGSDSPNEYAMRSLPLSDDLPTTGVFPVVIPSTDFDASAIHSEIVLPILEQQPPLPIAKSVDESASLPIGISNRSSSPVNESASSNRSTRSASRRRITLLQAGCDVFESAEIQETLDLDDQQVVLKEIQQICRKAVEKHHGHFVQLTDEGLMACFGYPIALEESSLEAVRAGLEIRDRIAKWNEQRLQMRQILVHVSSAIHSDYAVVEQKSGPNESLTLSILGQVRTVVSQLRLMADVDTLIVSHSTYRLVKGYFEFASLGMQSIKGISSRVELFRVELESKRGSRVDVVESSGLTPLIARDRELGLMQDRWEQAAEGRGQVLMLTGDAGLGKSRLVHELKKHVAGQCTGDLDPVLEWRCSQQHQDSSLHPVIDCFERLLDASREDSTDKKLNALVAHLRGLNLDAPEDVAIIAALLSLPVTDSFPKLNYSAQRLKEKTFDLLLEWLREQSQRHPILFVIEDLHWIDPTTLELLERAVENGQHESQLIILSCRPEFQPPWKNPNHLTQIALTRLTKRQIGELMQAKVGLKSVPPNIVDQIVERTDGVPLFVEEFTQMIVESGRLKHVDGEAELSVNFDIEEIPSTLQDLLMARLDRLESDEEIVQQAAAIGRDFSLELLQAITHMDEHSLELELAKLVQADLLSQRGRPPRIAYQFKHGLLRDAAYQSLVKKKRQEFHLRIGNALEEKFPETCETEPEILAQHFAQAGAAEKAIDYFERAGQRSLERSAHKEAIRHLTQGIELIDTLPKTRERNLQEIHLHISLGVPLQATRGYSAPEVEANYARARELCEMIDDDSEQFPILYGLFRFNMLRAKYAEASELAERVVSLAPPENLGFIVAAHRAVASPLVYQGMHDAALPHLRKVISIEPTLELRTASYRYDVVDPWITSQMYLAWTLWMLGYPDQALEQSRQSVAAARELRHPFSVALALNFSEWLFQFCGDVVQANKTVVEALELSHKHGFAFWFGWSKVIGGWVKAQQAPSESCVAEIREGIKEWRAQGSELGCHYFLVLLAEVCAQAGKISDALEALSDAEEFAKATGEGFMLSEIPRLRGEFLLHKKRIESAEAEVYFRDAIKIARDQESRSLELRAAMSLGRVLVNQSKSAEAIRVVEPLYEWFTEGFETYDLKQAKRLLASWK